MAARQHTKPDGPSTPPAVATTAQATSITHERHGGRGVAARPAGSRRVSPHEAQRLLEQLLRFAGLAAWCSDRLDSVWEQFERSRSRSN